MGKMLQKKDVISEDSIFSNNFSKKFSKIQFFYWIFSKNFQKFLKMTKQFVFRQKARKINTWFVKLFENMLK